jgi:hypothetical protein
MKKPGFICLLILLFGTGAFAQSYKTGLGVRFSSSDAVANTGVDARFFFKESVAVEGILSFDNHVALGLLLEKFHPLNQSDFSWFYGGGLYLGFTNPVNFGAHGILGLDYKIPTLPLNVSADWKPELNFTKTFSFEPAAVGLTIRFTFD